MALATTASGVRQLLIKVGDGADPEVFAHPCLINSQRGLKLAAETNEIIVPDCADPDLMAWIQREKKSLSGGIDGAGVLHVPDLEDYFNWFKSADPKNVKTVVDLPSVSGGRIFTGAYHLTNFEITGERGDKVQCSISLQSTGEITIANNV